MSTNPFIVSNIHCDNALRNSDSYRKIQPFKYSSSSTALFLSCDEKTKKVILQARSHNTHRSSLRTIVFNPTSSYLNKNAHAHKPTHSCTHSPEQFNNPVLCGWVGDRTLHWKNNGPFFRRSTWNSQLCHSFPNVTSNCVWKTVTSKLNWKKDTI